MAKFKLTRPELKHQRDSLIRFQRYLPMLKLKQQQLQIVVRDVVAEMHKADKGVLAARQTFDPYQTVLTDLAGVNVRELSSPTQVRTNLENIAGVMVPVFEGVDFPVAAYSLFATPAWVDGALTDLKEVNRQEAKRNVLSEEYRLLQKELTKIIQRVNLFEKVKIPEATEIIRRIRIHLGDEMTAAVGRAKIAKSKLTRGEADIKTGAEIDPVALEVANP